MVAFYILTTLLGYRATSRAGANKVRLITLLICHVQTAVYLASLPDDHPLQIALRTYALALSFALGPALLSSLTSPKALQDSHLR
ncbi:hypothetical protein A0H81_01129 [Grifola frondosa]|uniref:Uncharacterized protein n=1 Tax=Grifola frondosa TaxID=5627 RepID=A0A1C7MQM5_GRIFR|nr:hypothetical protein A0H81_01129 [Grifola frondosa]